MLFGTCPYHNKVTFSLTSNQRLGNKVHNCKTAYSFNRSDEELTLET